jgi:hypothetical protein
MASDYVVGTDHATDGGALDDADRGGDARDTDEMSVFARLARARCDDAAASDAARRG